MDPSCACLISATTWVRSVIGDRVRWTIALTTEMTVSGKKLVSGAKLVRCLGLISAPDNPSQRGEPSLLLRNSSGYDTLEYLLSPGIVGCRAFNKSMSLNFFAEFEPFLEGHVTRVVCLSEVQVSSHKDDTVSLVQSADGGYPEFPDTTEWFPIYHTVADHNHLSVAAR